MIDWYNIRISILKLILLTIKKVFRKTFKVLAWITGSLLFLLLLIYILIQVPAVQNFARQKLVSYLSKKTQSRIEIKKLSLDFPKRIVLEGVYFEDQKKDTLLYGGNIQVDIALMKLLRSKVEISYIGLTDFNANIYRNGQDSFFNYQYIIDAFATTGTTAQDSTGGMKISLDKINLENIRASFKDDKTGLDFSGRLGKFKTAFKEFDLDQMKFSLPGIVLENVSGHFYQNKTLLETQPMAVVEAESDEPFDVNISLENIGVKNIVFDYRNDVSVMAAKLNLGELSAKVKTIDLAKLFVQMGSIKLHNTTAGIYLGKSEQTVQVKEEINKEVTAQANNPWQFIIDNLDFENNNIVFKDDNKPASKGMDFANLKISSLKFKGNDFIVTPTAYSGNITTAGFNEQSGFNLLELKTSFSYSDTGAALKNLYVQTDKTLIRDNILVSYPSLDSAVKNIGSMYVDANFDNSKIAAKDILVFAPQLATYFKGNENAVINADAGVKGYLSDLQIPGFELSGIGNTSVSISGNIKGLPDVNKTRYDLNVKSFKTTKKDLEKFLPPGTIPATVRIPETINLSGSFKGLATSFTTNLLLQSNKGSAKLAGTLNSNNKTYDINGSINNLDIGYLVKQDTMVGKVTMSFAAKGTGFSPAAMNSKLTADMQSAFIKGYNYENLAVTASMQNGHLDVDAGMGDKSVAFKMRAQALIDDKFATNIKLRLLLDSILMQPLGFTSTDLRVHGNVIADIPVADMKAPQGTIQIAELVVANDGKRYAADTITVTAAASDTGQVLTLHSQVAVATLAGRYHLSTIAAGVMQVVDKYYNTGVDSTVQSKDQWTLTAAVIPDSLLFAFVPALVGTDTMTMNASFDGPAQKLGLLVKAPRIKMGEQVIDSLTITAGNTGDNLAYSVSVNSVGSKSFRLQQTNLEGYLQNDALNAHLNIKDIDGKDKYQLGLNAKQEPGGVIRTSLSDTLMLDYEKWNVSNGNYIAYARDGIIVHEFNISNSGQLLSVHSTTENKTAPLEVVLNNFRIKTLTNIAEQDSLRIDGLLNGNATISNVMTTPVFIADLALDTLTFNADTVGNILVKIDNQVANEFNADVSITGNENDVRLLGKYFTGEGKMDMKLAINNLNMASVKPFTFGALTQADGSLKGNVDIKGTASDPDINGQLHFDNAHITPKATGEKLLLSNEVISVSSKDIRFNNFTLADSAGNKAFINGTIVTDDFKTYNFNLGLTADNFRVMTAPPKQDALYYGDMNMDADISVRGTLTAPRINADLTINKSTDITFVLPSSSPEIESREGVVVFEDAYGPKTDSIFKATIDSLTRMPELAGIDLTSTLQSDTGAQITLVIDPRTGDALKIKGKANLAAAIDKSGKISLTGNYELQDGAYQLTLSLLKRQFKIQQGSVITWTGDPMSANVDITAVYIANTQPVNLLQSELANLSVTDINKYKAKVPFNVLLKMKGELMKPEITFDIQLPENQKSKWSDVDEKLEQVRRDEAELNKQVFALLLLNRFVQENPLENAADGTSLAGTAKSSVSRILTEQLNNLAGSLVKGVNLNFGVDTEDDYSSGTPTSRTNLTVGVSKNLLNDRLRVSVGSNFELEGPANTNQEASNIAGDVAVDYLMSKDGRYTLRAYRKNQYEGVIEGQVVESGVSFIFSFDFNEFKQIFNKKTAEQKSIEKAEKEKKEALEKEEQIEKGQVENKKTTTGSEK